MLRIKCWLAVTRNQIRDFLDIAALADRIGIAQAAVVIGQMDPYYQDINAGPEAVSTQVVRQLADPRPRDARTAQELDAYWAEVRRHLLALAEAVVA